MSPKTKKSSKKTKALKPAELFALAREHEQAKKDAAAAAKHKTEVDAQIIAELMDNRKVRSVESSEFGGFTRITVTQTESTSYDPEIKNDLTVAQRRLCFDRDINFNLLPEKTRKKILQSIPKDELAAVTTERLNVERLSQAVQDGKIDGKIVAKHASISKNKPYVTVSHGTGS